MCSKICIRRVTLYFRSRLSEWSNPIFSVSVVLITLDSSKKCRVVGLMSTISARKSLIAAVISGVVDSSGWQ